MFWTCDELLLASPVPVAKLPSREQDIDGKVGVALLDALEQPSVKLAALVRATLFISN